MVSQKIKLGHPYEKRLEESELMAIAKSWTSLQKMAYLRLRIPLEVSEQLTSMEGKIDQDSTEEQYIEMKKRVISILQSYQNPCSLIQYFQMRKDPNEAIMSNVSSLRRFLENIRIRIEENFSEDLLKEKLIEVIPLSIKTLIDFKFMDRNTLALRKNEILSVKEVPVSAIQKDEQIESLKR